MSAAADAASTTAALTPPTATPRDISRSETTSQLHRIDTAALSPSNNEQSAPAPLGQLTGLDIHSPFDLDPINCDFPDCGSGVDADFFDLHSSLASLSLGQVQEDGDDDDTRVDTAFNWDPRSALLLSPRTPTGIGGDRQSTPASSSTGTDLDFFLSSSSLLPHILPSAAAAAPAPFAPTAAVIYPSASSSSLFSSHSTPIPVSAPHAFDAAPTYRLVIEVVTNILAASPRPRALPAGCISSQVVSGRYQFYSPDPISSCSVLATTDATDGSNTNSSSNSSSSCGDDDDDDEFAATDPSRDARLCTIVVDSWKMVEPRSSPIPSLDDFDNGTVAQFHQPGYGQPNSNTKRPPSPAPRARFESTHEGTAHIACGILHLYREHAHTSNSAPSSSASSTRPPSPLTSPTSPPAPPPADSSTIHTASSHLLALLGVPQYLTAADLITWLGPFVDHISHLRMIRDHLPSRYLVLLRFREGAQARAFFAERNGRAFSAFEPQLAIIVKITSLTFTASSVPPFAFPHDVLCVDPAATTSATAAAAAPRPSPTSSTAPSRHSATSSAATTPVASASSVDLHELPTCPVCLERMDASVSGLMTILCQHTFHCGCLRRWDGTACPVCRYTYDSPTTTSTRSPMSTSCAAYPTATKCTTCSSTQDLWACLVCGRIGCGRYASGHAHEHFANCGHAFALELATRRVWDYARDQYVHRLVQAGPDGKVVEVAPGPGMGIASAMGTVGTAGSSASGSAVSARRGAAPGPGNDAHTNAYAPPPGYMVVAEADITRINKEYAWLLQSQVDAHRQVLEAQAARLTAWAAKVKMLVAQVQKRAAKAEAALSKVQAELDEEKVVSAGLARANRELKAEVERRDEGIRELEEQVRDLMVFVETRERIEQASAETREELAGGSVVGVGGAGGDGKKSGKKGKKGKGKVR
ncbi:hypothetical protein BCR44DRAFT_48397 [Catenaria anguillulae PL171]|uniref:BRCA1-associated protein 2-domain-containing protein n=1 Tax=Catenaria anguillulae PL171 TaxID=765915 RepID=A0A1Y2HBM9_9FUNG|nr:hypothetical protein BCR44DRAFT_48397 [Catenaria anguillulae PL171]